MSTPDAAPVEVAWVAGWPVAWLHTLPLGTSYSYFPGDGYTVHERTQDSDPALVIVDYWPDGTTPTPPAAPTTPDIADERDGWERVPGAWWSTSSGHAYMKRVDRDRNDPDDAPLYRPAALATPSTPGAGQAVESAPVRILRKLWEQTEIAHTATNLLVPKEWNEDEAPDRVALTPDEMAFWRALSHTPEPATGQGEPS